MTTPAVPHRPARVGNAPLGMAAASLAVGFVLLPRPLAALLSGHGHGDEQQLVIQVSAAFVGYWRNGQALTPELAHLVEYWRAYHAVKAVAATGLLVVLVVLATRLGRTYARTGPQATAWPSATGGIATAGLSVGAAALVLANVQGTLVPFSSLMSLLPVRSAGGDLAVTIGQVEQELARYPSGSSGPLRTMVGDLTSYHVVVAVIGWTAAAVLAVLTVASWRTYARTARTARRERRLFGALGIAACVMTVAVAVLALGNSTVTADPATALRNFYAGTF